MATKHQKYICNFYLQPFEIACKTAYRRLSPDQTLKRNPKFSPTQGFIHPERSLSPLNSGTITADLLSIRAEKNAFDYAMSSSKNDDYCSIFAYFG